MITVRFTLSCKEHKELQSSFDYLDRIFARSYKAKKPPPGKKSDCVWPLALYEAGGLFTFKNGSNSMTKPMSQKSSICIYLIEIDVDINENLKPIYNIKAN